MIELNERLRKARKKIGWTQEQTAYFFRLGSKEAVSMLESGHRALSEKKQKHRNIIQWFKKIEHMTISEAQNRYPAPLKQEKANRTEDDNFSPDKISSENSPATNTRINSFVNFPPEKHNENCPSEADDCDSYGEKRGVTHSRKEGGKPLEETEEALGEEFRFKALPNRIDVMAKKAGGCLLCGRMRGPNPKYWEDLSELITSRAIILLKAAGISEDEVSALRGYSHGILDLLGALLSRNRQQMLHILEKEGYVDAFLSRLSFEEIKNRYFRLSPRVASPVERKADTAPQPSPKKRQHVKRQVGE